MSHAHRPIRVGGSTFCAFCSERLAGPEVVPQGWTVSETQAVAVVNATTTQVSISQLVQIRNVRTHDNTMMSTWNKCPYLYYLQYVRNLRPNGSAAPLKFGALVHLGLSTWYDHFKIEGATHETALAAALEIMMKAEYEDEFGDFRTKARALLLMAEYAEYYQFMEVQRGWKVIFTEQAFDIEHPEGFPWGGKMDLAIEWRGQIYVVDHKTTSRFGDTYWDQYVPDKQTCGYAASVEHLTGRKVAGVIVNVLVVHKNKKPAADQFKWRAFDYPRFYFDDWRAQVKSDYEEIAKAQETGYYRQRWESCVGKFGRCPAYHVCRTLPANRERKLAAEWHEEVWDWRAVEAETE